MATALAGTNHLVGSGRKAGQPRCDWRAPIKSQLQRHASLREARRLIASVAVTFSSCTCQKNLRQGWPAVVSSEGAMAAIHLFCVALPWRPSSRSASRRSQPQPQPPTFPSRRWRCHHRTGRSKSRTFTAPCCPAARSTWLYWPKKTDSAPAPPRLGTLLRWPPPLQRAGSSPLLSSIGGPPAARQQRWSSSHYPEVRPWMLLSAGEESTARRKQRPSWFLRMCHPILKTSVQGGDCYGSFMHLASS